MASTKELRDHAGELRNRISFLQRHPPGSGSKRNSVVNGSPALEQEEEAFQSEVQALEQHLERQEEAIEQLEGAERSASVDPDPRAEWHQVLDYNEGQSDGSASDDDYDEADSNEYEDVLADTEETTPATDGAHEDRSDAFDYEHFILHSGMGTYAVTDAERSSASSASTASTPRGISTEGDTYVGRGWPRTGDEGTSEPNESAVSLASYETATEGEEHDGDLGSHASDSLDRANESDELQDPWPIQPSSRSSLRRSGQEMSDQRESSVPTPTPYSFSRALEYRGVQLDLAQRPVSTIYAALTAHEEASAQASELDEKELVRATIQSLHQVCQTLKDANSQPSEKKLMRERLEVARRVLDGEL